MNDIIYELDLDLDIDHLADIALNGIAPDGAPSHHRLVSSDTYLQQIKNRYSFLSGVFNVYKHPPGYSLDIHIDADRFCAINIPICNTQDSMTMFYDKNDSAELQYDSRRILNLVKSATKECFRFTLTKPTLINTSYPHSVINNSDQTRIIISWSVLRPMTFQECLVSMTKVI